MLATGAWLQAQPAPKARLVYVRGPGADQCPDDTALENAVASRLGYFPFETEGRLTVVATIDRNQDTYRARVELRNENGKTTGTRELSSTSSDCSSVFEAIAVAISIGLEPFRIPGQASAPASASSPPPAASSSEPEPSIAPAPAQAPPVAPPAPEPAPPPDDAPRPELTLGAGAHWALGTSPSGALAVQGQVGLRWPGYSIALELGGQLPRTTSVDGGRLKTSLLAGRLVVCRRGDPWFACGVVVGGSLAGSGEGISTPTLEHAAYVALGLRAGASVEIPGTGVDVQPYAELLGGVTSTTFYLNYQPVFTTSPVQGSVGLALVGAVL